MKTVFRSLLVLALLATVAWGVFHFMSARHAEPAEAADHTEHAGETEQEKPEAGVVKVDHETQERIALAVAPLEGAQSKPERVAYGRVLDPAPLLALDGEMASTEAALEMSRAANERAQGLFRAGENVARKSVESASEQLRLDEIKLQGLRRRLALEWGESLAALDAKARAQFIERLLRGSAAFVRADLSAGDNATDAPTAARVALLGREDAPITAAEVAPAATTDPKTQAQGYLLRIDSPPFPLRAGMALSARLEMPGEPEEGVTIPRSAVVRSNGRAWIYVQTGEEEFTREEVELGAPGEAGWFVAGELKPGEKVVVTGAQTLLSQEAKALGGGGEEE